MNDSISGSISDLFVPDISEDDVILEISRRSRLSLADYRYERDSKKWLAYSRAIDSYFSKQPVACRYFREATGTCGMSGSWNIAICRKGFAYNRYFTHSAEDCKLLCSDFKGV